jgi:DNA invertase Pin-like site-specific DNA recombinase
MATDTLKPRPAKRQGDKLARHLAPPTLHERKARGLDRQPAFGHVYGYARVSTLAQADEGESLGQQERAIAGYALMNGLTVERVFVERGVSGSRPLAERPKGKEMLDALRPGDVVITPKLDRMFRSALDALDILGKLQKQGVSLHMIDLGGDTTGNGISKLVFTILSAVAEAERDRIRERVSDVKRDQKSRGRFLGGTVPFGYTVGNAGELVEVPEQQRAIKRMRQLRARNLSLRKIQAKLVDEGLVEKIAVATIVNALAAEARA